MALKKSPVIMITMFGIDQEKDVFRVCGVKVFSKAVVNGNSNVRTSQPIGYLSSVTKSLGWFFLENDYLWTDRIPLL